MDNRDGTLSIFTTMLSHAAPEAPPPARGGELGPAALASISRRLASGRRPAPRAKTAGVGGRMRNVEMVLRDPRRR
jgi:hypothetical protein